MFQVNFRKSFLLVVVATVLAGLAGCEASTQADAKTPASPRSTVHFKSVPESGVRVVAEGERNCVTPCDLEVGKGEVIGFFYGATQLPVAMGPWTDGMTYTVTVDGAAGGDAGAPAPTASNSNPPATEPPKAEPTEKLTVMWWGPRGLVRLGDGATVDVPFNYAKTILTLYPASPEADSVTAAAPLSTEVLDNRVHVVLDLRGKDLKPGQRFDGLRFTAQGVTFHFNAVVVGGPATPVATR